MLPTFPVPPMTSVFIVYLLSPLTGGLRSFYGDVARRGCEDACVSEMLKVLHRRGALSRKPVKIVSFSTAFPIAEVFKFGMGEFSSKFRGFLQQFGVGVGSSEDRLQSAVISQQSIVSESGVRSSLEVWCFHFPINFSKINQAATSIATRKTIFPMFIKRLPCCGSSGFSIKQLRQ